MTRLSATALMLAATAGFVSAIAAEPAEARSRGGAKMSTRGMAAPPPPKGPLAGKAPPVVNNPTTYIGNPRHPYYRPHDAGFANGGVIVVRRPKSRNRAECGGVC